MLRGWTPRPESTRPMDLHHRPRIGQPESLECELAPRSLEGFMEQNTGFCRTKPFLLG